LLECANDWKLRVDFDAKKAEFPPAIVATALRPDIVLWSRMSRIVVLIELTCPAEEGMLKAQLRKETKYSALLDNISATEVWRPLLFTVEIGARGLVSLSTHKTFVRLGFTSSQAKALCKKLSSVVVRCSYAVYQAHNNLSWSHGSDLIVVEGARDRAQASVKLEDPPLVDDFEAPPRVDERESEGVGKREREGERAGRNNVRTLRDNGIETLFHFTDESNLESISKRGLLTWKKLGEQQVPARLNSSELSHHLDVKAGLADFVRLSFCKKHPMMYVALHKKRISRPVVLEIKLEAVSRRGVLFCEINAASTAAKVSEDPSVIHFEAVKASSLRELAASEQRFFQGEVLVPDWIPPHLIKIPKVDAFTKPLELRGSLPEPNLVGCTLSGNEIGVKDSTFSSTTVDNKPSSTTKPFSTPSNQLLTVASGPGTSTPKPLVSPLKVHFAGNGKSIHETFVAPTGLRFFRLSSLRSEREKKLAQLVDSHHLLQCAQFLYDADKDNAFRMSRSSARAEKAKPHVDERACGCEMPLSRPQASCEVCTSAGHVMNCSIHMRACTGPAWLACNLCDRFLCWDHMSACYCVTKVVGAHQKPSAREKLRDRERARESKRR
jgi:hypothetical protein